MKKNRIVYLLYLIGISVLTFCYSGRIMPIVLITSVAVPLISAFLLIISYFSVSASVYTSQAVSQKNQEFYLDISVKNNCFLPLAPVCITGVLHGADNTAPEKRRLVVGVAPFKSIKVSYKGKIGYRGCYTIGVNEIQVFDLLKLFSVKKKVHELVTVNIIPRIIDTSLVPMKSSDEDDTDTLANKGFDKNTFAYVREYRDGDNMRFIHWNMTAKLDEITVKQMEQTVCGKMVLVTNLELYADNIEENIIQSDAVIELSIAITKYLVDNSISVDNIWLDVLYGNTIEEFTEDSDSFGRFYSRISFAPVRKRYSGGEKLFQSVMSKVRQFGTVCFVTSLLDENYLALLEKCISLSNASVYIFIADAVNQDKQITDYAEKNLSAKIIEADINDLGKSVEGFFR